MIASARRKWLALALLCAVQFMVILDIAIVNVALPSIQVDLGFSQENLQWVISAYALIFGGFLLLGGRHGRHHRSPQAVHDRSGRLHGRIAALRALLGRGVADRQPGHPGPRRRDHLARRSRDPDDDLQRRPGAEHRARRMGRRRRLRCGSRRAARRGSHGRALVGVDLLREHPGRHGRPGAGADAARREPRPACQALRRHGCVPRHERARGCWSTASRRRTSSAGRPGRRSPCSSALSACCGLRGLGAAQPRTAGAVLDLQAADADRIERRPPS